MKHEPWKTLSSRPIYSNPWMSLREDIAEMPDGRTTLYGVVTFGDCVGVVPLLDDGRVLLVRQYRYVQKDARWEIPTGGCKEGEPLEEAAQRELQEEAGYRAGKLTWLSSYYTSKSVCDETAHLYLGEGLSPAPRPADETEFLETRAFPFSEALRMVVECEIMDSMSVIALLHLARLRGELG
ncbi:MAG: NUDIX domain-containing protein [Anaerolineae bacterium]|jgi:ADP-ribose pyrophosphatase